MLLRMKRLELHLIGTLLSVIIPIQTSSSRFVRLEVREVVFGPLLDIGLVTVGHTTLLQTINL